MIKQAIIPQRTANDYSILKRHLFPGLISGLIAASVNSSFYLLAQTQGGLLINAGQTVESISLASILAFSFFPATLAAGLYWILVRFTGNPKIIFLTIAAMVYLGFFFGPISVATNRITLWTLELMHLTAALTILTGLLRVKGS